jgi:hypothetical protein
MEIISIECFAMGRSSFFLLSGGQHLSQGQKGDELRLKSKVKIGPPQGRGLVFLFGFFSYFVSDAGFSACFVSVKSSSSPKDLCPLL